MNAVFTPLIKLEDNLAAVFVFWLMKLVSSYPKLPPTPCPSSSEKIWNKFSVFSVFCLWIQLIRLINHFAKVYLLLPTSFFYNDNLGFFISLLLIRRKNPLFKSYCWFKRWSTHLSRLWEILFDLPLISHCQSLVWPFTNPHGSLSNVNFFFHENMVCQDCSLRWRSPKYILLLLFHPRLVPFSLATCFFSFNNFASKQTKKALYHL